MWEGTLELKRAAVLECMYKYSISKQLQQLHRHVKFKGVALGYLKNKAASIVDMPLP